MPTGSKKVKVVLDTNVFVSGLNFEGKESRVLILFYRGEIEVYLSIFILEELKRILKRKFRWEEGQIKRTLNKIKNSAVVVHPKSKVSVIKEKDSNNRILECALEVKADYIISGDTKHLQPLKEFQGIPILSPAQFLATISRE